MKQVSTLLCFLLLISFLNAQDIEVASVPTAVMDEFMLRYPDAKSTSWQMVPGQEKYRADFKNNKMATTAILSADGHLVETETQIRTCALPEPALHFLAEKYTDKKIEMASIMEDESGTITFEAVIEQVDFTFDSTGQVMSTNEVVFAGGRNR
ncbi:MAG: PepSY-like domain-containing protein [Saprospiraceae bacterium]|nr:PepSY-like domain-containing protein [Candidatus Opimibacter iunctus]